MDILNPQEKGRFLLSVLSRNLTVVCVSVVVGLSQQRSLRAPYSPALVHGTLYLHTCEKLRLLIRHIRD